MIPKPGEPMLSLLWYAPWGQALGLERSPRPGRFNVVTQNTTDLIMYADFSVINKGADDSLVITWTLTFA